MAAIFIGGAFLRAVIGELVSGMEVATKAREFKSVFKRLQSTLNQINAVVKDYEKLNRVLDRSGIEFVDRLLVGKILLLKCSKVHRWNIYAKAVYAKKLIAFEKLLVSVFLIDVTWQISVDSKNEEKETTREASKRKCDLAGHIAFSSSELALNNGAHPGRQDQRGSSASRPDKETKRETKNGEGTYSRTISREELAKYFGRSRQDVVRILGISVSTFKRVCRYHGIHRWPYSRSKSVKKNPDRLEGQTTQSTAHLNPSALVSPQPQTSLTHMLSENEDRRHLLASGAESVLNGHVFESSNLVFGACSDAAAASQATFRVLQKMPMTTQAMPLTGGFFETFQLEGQLTPSASSPNSNALMFPQLQTASTHMLNENMVSLEYCKRFLGLDEEPLEGQASESAMLKAQAISQTGGFFETFQLEGQSTQSASNPNPNALMFPQLQTASTHMLNENMVSLEYCKRFLGLDEEPLEGQVSESAMLKVKYGDKTIKFQLPLMSGIFYLKQEVSKRLNLEPGSFDVEYKDEDGEWIFLGCDEDLRKHLQLFSNQVIRLLVVPSDANTTNFSESCGSLKRKRP